MATHFEGAVIIVVTPMSGEVRAFWFRDPLIVRKLKKPLANLNIIYCLFIFLQQNERMDEIERRKILLR